MTANRLAVRNRTVRYRYYRSSPGWLIAALAVLVPAVVPPLVLAGQLIGSGFDFGIPTARLAELMANTIALTIAVTATALFIATVLAWLLTRTDLSGRRFWSVLVALPLVIPSYVAALTIIGASGPGGMFARAWGISLPTPYGFFGSWIALSVFLAPMAYLIIAPGLASIDPGIEEAARGLGASPRRVFLTVTVPQLRPALVSAGLMVGLYTISDFGAVSLLRFDTFTRAIFSLYAGQIDRRPAGALSLLLMVLAVVIILLERRTRTRARFDSSKTAKTRPSVPLAGWRRYAGYTALGGYVVAALAGPVSVLIYWLLRGSATGIGLASLGDEVARSFGVAVGAAALVVVAAFPVAMATTWRKQKASGAIEATVWSMYSLPHIAVGVAVVTFALNYARPLYQTLPLLLIVYAAMFLAQAMTATQDSLLRADPTLEDASRSLGRGPVATLSRVTVPIAARGLLAGAALVFISTIKELPATLLLRPTGFETLAIRIWSATGEGFYTTAAAAGLILLAVSVVPLFVLTRRDLIT